jgi:hypothetical protein
MGFTHEAHFVTGGHKMDTPSTLTYSSIISWESVHIAFPLATLNDLKLLSADIFNAYINADSHEKVYFIAGGKFGLHNKGKTVIITRLCMG